MPTYITRSYWVVTQSYVSRALPLRLPAQTKTGTSSLGTALRGTVAVTKLSSRTPNYQELKDRGMLPVQPFSWVRQTDRTDYAITQTRLISGNVETTNTVTNQYDWGKAPGGDLPTTLPRFDPHPSVKLAMNQKIKEVKIDLGVLIGERKATVATLVNLIQRASSAVAALKAKNPVLFYRALTGDLNTKPKPPKKPPHGATKRSRKKFRLKAEAYRAEKALYDNYLQWKYGIKPILQDAHGAGEQLAKMLTKRLREKVTAKRVFNHSASKVFGTSASYKSLSLDVEYSVKHSCLVEIDASMPALLSEVGLTNPANIAWNVLTLSFVADWFYPFGNIINNFDVFVGRSIKHYCVGTMLKETRRAEYGFSIESGLTYQKGTAGTTSERIAISRQLGDPGVVLWVPPEVPDLGIDKIAAALSLLGQRYR